MTNKPIDDRPIEVRLTEDATESLSGYLGMSTKSPTANTIRRTVMETVKLAWANGHAAGRLTIRPDAASIRRTAQQVYVELHANDHTPSRNEISHGLERAVRLGIVYQMTKQDQADAARSESEQLPDTIISLGNAAVDDVIDAAGPVSPEVLLLVQRAIQGRIERVYAQGINDSTVERELLRLNTVEVMLHDSVRGDEATIVQIDTEGPARVRVRINDEAVWDGDPETGRDYLARPEITTDDVMASIGAMLSEKYGITMETGPLVLISKQTAELIDETLDIPGTHTKRSDSEQEGSAS